MDAYEIARDGVTLYADVWHPDEPGRYPVLLSRSPYGKDGASANPNSSNALFARNGYVTIMQDCRGRFSSEGEYDTIFQEIEDGYDAVEWAARLPWSNGRVGTTGQSYLGLTQYAIACNDPMPPSLQAMAPVSASSDFHASWIYHTGGAAMWGWMVPYAIHKGRNTLEREGLTELLAKMDEYVVPATNFGQPLHDQWYRHLPIKDWSELLAETAPYFADHVRHADDGEYWYRANVNRHAPSVNVPMLHISSWYDIFAEGAPSAYRSIGDQSRYASARKNQRLIMGPWAHLFPYVVPNSRGTGDIDFGPAALVDLHQVLLRWFDYWLKDVETGIMDEPPVSIFTMGENRWQTLPDWPPPNMREVRYYLHSSGSANSASGDGTLSTVPPADEPTDRYTYDPDDPVPSLGGANLTIPPGSPTNVRWKNAPTCWCSPRKCWSARWRSPARSRWSCGRPPRRSTPTSPQSWWTFDRTATLRTCWTASSAPAIGTPPAIPRRSNRGSRTVTRSTCGPPATSSFPGTRSDWRSVPAGSPASIAISTRERRSAKEPRG